MKSKEHFSAASLQAWKGWVGRGNAGIPPRALTKGIIELIPALHAQQDLPYRQLPKINSLGSSCKGVGRAVGLAGQYPPLCLLLPPHSQTGCSLLPQGWLKTALEQSLVLRRDWSCLSCMARTATGTQTSPFMVRAVWLQFCISPRADVSKRIPSFGRGAGLDPILLQLLWLPQGD